MRRIRPAWICLLLATVLQLSLYGAYLVSYVRSGQVRGADFRWFYAVGMAMRQDGPGSAYDLRLAGIEQARVAGKPVGTEALLLPNHPPFVFPLMALLAGLEYSSAYLVNFLLTYLVTALVLVRLARELRARGWRAFERLAFLAGLLLFEPFFISALKGQDTYLLLIGGLLLFAGFQKERDWLAGLGLALTLVRPQVALVLALPFLFDRRRVFWWFLAGGLAFGLLSFALVGWNGAQQFVAVLRLSTGVQGYDADEKAMVDSVGLLLRLLPGLGLETIHALGWGLFGAATVGACLAWRFARPVRLWHLCLSLVLALFAAPHLHYHDLAVLAAPLAAVALLAVRRGRLTRPQAAAALTGVSLLFLFGEFWDPARLSLPYLVLLGVPLAAAWLARPLPAGEVGA